MSRYFSLVEFLRRSPKSYYDQTYYSHFVYEFIGKDRVKRLAKLRLMPADGSEESGLLTKREQKYVWYARFIYFLLKFTSSK